VVAIVQPDLKKLVAYSSVSHLGFIVLGTFALTAGALQGGVIQMINHGITTGALFLLVGMLYDRRHTKQIADFGGLAGSMPIFAGLFLFTAFASIGLPGLNGFVGEFMVLLGSYVALPGWSVVAALGVILAAIYLLWAYQRVFTGPLDRPENESVPDLTGREIALMVPLVVLMLYLGLQPKVLLDRIEPSTNAVIERVADATGYRVELPANQLLAEAPGE
jgi:NADH-quinone oxidoreductase subunit M